MNNPLSESLSSFDLWTSLFEELHCFHKSAAAHKKYSFTCRNCDSFTLTSDIVPAGCSWNCSNCHCEKEGDTFVDLVLATTQLRKLTSARIIDVAFELVLRHQRWLKKQTPVLVDGCYEINRVVVPVRPVRPAKPSKTPIRKPRSPRKPKGSMYECK